MILPSLLLSFTLVAAARVPCDVYDGQPATCTGDDSARVWLCCYCNATGACQQFRYDDDDTPDTTACGDADGATWTCNEAARENQRRLDVVTITIAVVVLSALFGAVALVAIVYFIALRVRSRKATVARNRNKSNV